MKVVFKLFSELIRQFPLHFIFLFSFVFLQALLNTLSVVAVAPITDLLLERSGENASKITQFFEKLLKNEILKNPPVISYTYFDILDSSLCFHKQQRRRRRRRHAYN